MTKQLWTRLIIGMTATTIAETISISLLNNALIDNRIS